MLLDTSVVIDFLRQSNKSATWLYALAVEGHVFSASMITHTELYAGKSVWEKEVALGELRGLFSAIRLVPITETISQTAGKIRSVYNLDLIDAIIAATAVEEKITLATLNYKHFASVEGVKLLEV